LNYFGEIISDFMLYNKETKYFNYMELLLNLWSILGNKIKNFYKPGKKEKPDIH